MMHDGVGRAYELIHCNGGIKRAYNLMHCSRWRAYMLMNCAAALGVYTS